MYRDGFEVARILDNQGSRGPRGFFFPRRTRTVPSANLLCLDSTREIRIYVPTEHAVPFTQFERAFT